MKKRILVITMLIVMPLLAAGCGKSKPADMKALDESGSYTYRNEDLGFSLTLPKEFEYYQTQRKNDDGVIALEIFVPTSDRMYAQEVEGYAKPLVVKVIDSGQVEAIENEISNDNAKKVSEAGGKTYFIEVWQKQPADWESKWTDEMENSIISTFKNI